MFPDVFAEHRIKNKQTRWAWRENVATLTDEADRLPLAPPRCRWMTDAALAAALLRWRRLMSARRGVSLF